MLFATLYAFRNLLVPEIPWGLDHTVHMHHAWVMSDHLLPTGSVTGWSHTQFAGYPAFTLYAPLPYLLIAALDWLGGTLISLDVAYLIVVIGGVSFGLAMSVWVMLVSHGVSRSAALVAGLMLVFARGGYNEGGWEQVYVDGVWPHVLALVMLVLVITAMGTAVRRPTRLRIGGLALATAAALLTHPIGFVHLAIAVPCYLLAFVRSWRGLMPVALGLALGALLSAFWWLPFLEMSGFVRPQGEAWMSWVELGPALWSGSVWTSSLPGMHLAGAITIVACLVAAPRVGAFARFGLLIVASFLLLGTSTPWEVLGLDDYRVYLQINFRRFRAVSKIGWTVFAAVGVVMVVRRFPVRSRPVLSAVVLAAAVGAVWPLAGTLKAEVFDAPHLLQPMSESPLHADIEDAYAALEDHIERTGARDYPFRVLIRDIRGIHCNHVLPRRLGVGLAQDSTRPTFHFWATFVDERPASLAHNLATRYALTCANPLPSHVSSRLLFQRDHIALYELGDYRPV
ncbi:MAG: hypothetical protein ACI9OJ_003945, partial [Myxococcota bacterium]